MVSTPQNGPNAPLDAVFARRGPVYPRFGVFWAVPAHQKWVKNGSKIGQNECDLIGVRVDVFLARFEAYLGGFDSPCVAKSLPSE